MPRQTKKQRAEELLRTVECGPIFLGQPWKDEVSRGYQNWVQTWVLPELKRLIPEEGER